MSTTKKTNQLLEPTPEPDVDTLDATVSDHATQRWRERVAPDDADIHAQPLGGVKQTVELAWRLGEPVYLPDQSYNWARKVGTKTLGENYIEGQTAAFMLAVDTRDEDNNSPAVITTVITHPCGNGQPVRHQVLENPTVEPQP